MVLVVIAILAVLAGNFAASMKVETMLARNASFDSEFEWLGRAGIEAAKAILADQKEPFASLNQYWAGGPAGTNGSFAEFDLHHFPIGDSGMFVDITIEDAIATDTRPSTAAGDSERGDPLGSEKKRPYFIQMKGIATISGRLDGKPLSGTGTGFFETYR